MNDQKLINEGVERFVIGVVKEIKTHKGSEDELYRALILGLDAIVREYGTLEYKFNLAMEFFVERSTAAFTAALERLLSECECDEDSEDEELDTVFTAYYALSLIYKKSEVDFEKLKALVIDSRYAEMLGSYPLLREVYSRYYKRTSPRRLREALDYDKLAINILAAKGIKNLAVCISYVSTVCSMLETGVPMPSASELGLAFDYVDEAIAFNPAYPKYYWLKARLNFFSGLRKRGIGIQELTELADEAKALITAEAEPRVHTYYNGKARFEEAEYKSYAKTKENIDLALDRRRNPKFALSDEALDECKRQLLSSQSNTEIASSLPRNPAHRRGDKYFFICYSTDDYKSVYCDLIELYRRRVPFCYDGRLQNGIDWTHQIEMRVSDEDCAGVVFYLSRSILKSNAVFREIELVKRHGKPYFSVNLEGNVPPSKIMLDAVIDKYRVDSADYAIPGELMRRYLDFFRDEEVFTAKMPAMGDDGMRHLDALCEAIANTFPSLKIGEQ